MNQVPKIFTFIDNSNLYIEAKRVARVEFAYDASQVFRLRIDFGKLLDVTRENRPIGGTVLVGSRPPQADTLWSRLKALGISPKIFDQSPYTGKEKGVDAEVVNAIRDVLEENPKTNVISLVLDQFLPQISFLAAERPAGGSGRVAEGEEQYAEGEIA